MIDEESTLFIAIFEPKIYFRKSKIGLQTVTLNFYNQCDILLNTDFRSGEFRYTSIVNFEQVNAGWREFFIFFNFYF